MAVVTGRNWLGAAWCDGHRYLTVIAHCGDMTLLTHCIVAATVTLGDLLIICTACAEYLQTLSTRHQSTSATEYLITAIAPSDFVLTADNLVAVDTHLLAGNACPKLFVVTVVQAFVIVFAAIC